MVSVGAALEDRPDLAIGNVVGSNIANILLILGLAAVITPLSVQERVVRRDAVVMLLASACLAVLAMLGSIDRWAGALLTLALGAFVVITWVSGRREATVTKAYAEEAEEVAKTLPGWKAVLVTVAGLVLLIVGARMLVTGSVDIARGLGVPEAVIGLTLVAVGTSLPELATSTVAAVRGHTDVAVGNVVGSNIFNILGIVGITALLTPLPFAGRMADIDVWVMLGVALAGALMMRTGWALHRREGVLCLAAYGGYSTYLFVA